MIYNWSKFFKEIKQIGGAWNENVNIKLYNWGWPSTQRVQKCASVDLFSEVGLLSYKIS